LAHDHIQAGSVGDASIAIAARNIRKIYGPTVALNDVGFDIRAGDTHALLGANGAGKSTLVKLLSGLILPTTGGLAITGNQRLSARRVRPMPRVSRPRFRS